MIQLLFFVLFAESATAFLLLVEIEPLRALVMKGLDQLKIGNGPATVKIIGGIMVVILVFSIMSILEIQNKGEKLGTVSLMDQVLWRTRLLEASLAGFVLFLGFIVDRMHLSIMELLGLMSSTKNSKGELERLQKEKTDLKDREEKSSKEIKSLQERISSLSGKLNQLKMECEEKDKTIQTTEARIITLQKQSAELLLEYDQLLEENQTLQNQALGGHKS